MPLELHARDPYIRHTDVNGKSTPESHRVWDADIFLAARRRDCQKANSEQKDGLPGKAGVEQITRDQYLKERQAQK